MNVRPMTPAQARALVEGRLGRAPQDALEAAVVLEAWGGVRPPLALRLGASLMGVGAGAGTDPAGRRPQRPEPDTGMLAENLAILFAVVAMAAWAGPLAQAFGSSSVELAWRLALPVTLAVQWTFRRRYLAGVDGLGRFRSQAAVLARIHVLAVLVPAALLGRAGALAGMMIVLWTSGAIVARRGWGWGYAALLLAAAAGMRVLDPLPIILVTVALTAAMAVGARLAVMTAPASQRRPAPWQRAVPAGLIGAGLGLLLLLDPTVRVGTGGIPAAVALIPSVAGGLWGGAHLSRIWDIVPRTLEGVSALDREPASLTGPAMVVLMGAVGRLAGCTLALSVAVVLAAGLAGQPLGGSAGLLTGFGLISVAGLVCGLLESFGCWPRALVGVAAGLVAGMLGAALLGLPAPGGSMILGSLVVLLVTLPTVFRLARSPGRMLGTVMSIL